MRSPADLAESFSEDDIADWLGENELVKGRSYVDLVRDFTSRMANCAPRSPARRANPIASKR